MYNFCIVGSFKLGGYCVFEKGEEAEWVLKSVAMDVADAHRMRQKARHPWYRTRTDINGQFVLEKNKNWR